MSLSPGGPFLGILAIEDRPELEVQRRVIRQGRDLGERLAFADEIADVDLHLGDVVVVGDEAQPAWMMVDADVGRVTAGLDLDFDDATTVGGVDTVPRCGGEVDGRCRPWEKWTSRPVGFDGSSTGMT